MRFLRNENGHTAAFMCISMPLIIAVLGVCIDGSLLLYYKARLMTATKLAAVSATSFYEIENDQLIIDLLSAEDAALRTLGQNFESAVMTRFEIDSVEKNTCTVDAQVEVPFYFLRMLEAFGSGITHKTLMESYTASRSIDKQGDD
ncbi:MAG: hypothetical protein GX660_25960 [Clostridiaceae bacterium]|nr:hypothetical protein [Clostridiaceae bacterium]